MAAFQLYYYLVCLNSDLLKAFMKGLTSFFATQSVIFAGLSLGHINMNA